MDNSQIAKFRATLPISSNDLLYELYERHRRSQRTHRHHHHATTVHYNDIAEIFVRWKNLSDRENLVTFFATDIVIYCVPMDTIVESSSSYDLVGGILQCLLTGYTTIASYADKCCDETVDVVRLIAALLSLSRGTTLKFRIERIS